MRYITRKLLIFLILLPLAGYAQFNDTAYVYTYGGVQNDNCNQAQLTWDGGYILIGTTSSFGAGNTSFYTIRTDSLGRKKWSNTYGGPLNQGGYAVTPTLDKGFAFVGFTDSYGAGGYDVFLVKTDSNGKMQWQKTYGGADWDFGYSIKQTKDSGYVICGLTYSYGKGNGDVYVIRTNKLGDTLWTRTFGDAGYDAGNSVYVRNDSLYYIAGVTTSFGRGDTSMYFIELDNQGIFKWDTVVGTRHNCIVGSMRETSDKGFLIYGSTDSIPDSTYVRKYGETMIKMDSLRRIKWWNVFKSNMNGEGLGNDAVQTNSGNYLTISTNNNCGLGGFSMDIKRFDNNGNPQTGACFGGTKDEYGNSIAYRDKNHLVFAGTSDSYGCGLFDMYVVRFTSDSIVPNYILSMHNYCDTLSPAAVQNTSSIEVETRVFPNPMSQQSTILVQGEQNEHYWFSLYDVEGNCLQNDVPLGNMGHNQSYALIKRNNTAAGTYIYRIRNSHYDIVNSGKLVIE